MSKAISSPYACTQAEVGPTIKPTGQPPTALRCCTNEIGGPTPLEAGPRASPIITILNAYIAPSAFKALHIYYLAATLQQLCKVGKHYYSHIAEGD